MRRSFAPGLFFLLLLTEFASAAGAARDVDLGASSQAIVEGLQKTNSCLSIQTQLSNRVERRGTVIAIREVCESYNREYVVTRVTELDLADVDYRSVSQFYEDNTTVAFETWQGRALTITASQRYVLPPYTVTTSTDRLTSLVIRFTDGETAGWMRKALKEAVRRCHERKGN
jgi:hypothetical protein